MKKMRLNPDQLAVESFPTAAEDQRALGTVHAQGSGLGCASENLCDPSYSADGECICGNHDTQPTTTPGCIE